MAKEKEYRIRLHNTFVTVTREVYQAYYSEERKMKTLDEKDIRNKIELIRKILPDATLRTTIISGFPGESEAAHNKLLDFVKDIKFDRLGVFEYSMEDGTPAEKLDGHLDDSIKEKRRMKLCNYNNKFQEV